MRAGAGCAALLALSACVAAPADRGAGGPDFLGVETRLLDDDLVNLVVAARGAGAEQTVKDYALCAAARYALIRGYGFARHVRTSLSEEGSLWRADAVYTISPSLPRGTRTIDAEVTVADCDARGIPTV
jgi:hypothetical protein